MLVMDKRMKNEAKATEDKFIKNKRINTEMMDQMENKIVDKYSMKIGAEEKSTKMEIQKIAGK